MSLFRRESASPTTSTPGRGGDLSDDGDSDPENVARLVLIDPRTGPSSFQSGVSMATYRGPQSHMMVLAEDGDTEWPTPTTTRDGDVRRTPSMPTVPTVSSLNRHETEASFGTGGSTAV